MQPPTSTPTPIPTPTRWPTPKHTPSHSHILRFAAFVLIAVLALQAIESINCSKYYGRHAAFQFREKPRATRGFKSVALSTARGFGKRDPSYKVSGSDVSYVDSPFNAAQRFAQKDRYVYGSVAVAVIFLRVEYALPSYPPTPSSSLL